MVILSMFVYENTFIGNMCILPLPKQINRYIFQLLKSKSYVKNFISLIFCAN